MVSVTPLPRFIPGKGPLLPTVQEAGWAPELVWTQKLEVINILCLCWESNPGHPDHKNERKLVKTTVLFPGSGCCRFEV
jgi:hypothetical protein